MFLKKYFRKLGALGIASALIAGVIAYKEHRDSVFYQRSLPVLKTGGLQEVMGLFKQGLSATTKDNTGSTPIFKVSQHNINPTVARAVARKTHHKKVVNKKGYTPLMLASSRNVVGVVKALVQEGFPVNTQAGNGLSALMLAAKNNPHVEVAQFLLTQGADVRQKTDQGMNALHYAVLRRTLEIAKSLLEAGAEVNATDRGGRTALIWTVLKGENPKMVDLLMKQGAQINQADAHGKTALMYALSMPGKEAYALELLKFNPDLFYEDPEGKNALDYAKRNYKLPKNVYTELNQAVKKIKRKNTSY